MNLQTSIFQRASLLSHYPAYAHFRKALLNPEVTQRAILDQYLTNAKYMRSAQSYFGGEIPRHYEAFSARAAVTQYSDWETSIEAQRKSPKETIFHPSARFEPTSGSTHFRKWIPYSKPLMGEFDRAASAWIYDIARQYPKVLNGRHYWSLSCLPDDLRGKTTNSDLEIFPVWKRFLMKRLFAVDPSLAMLPTVEQSLIATLVQLSDAEDLTLISVWSPTFALELLRELSRRREAIASLLRKPNRAHLLRQWNGEIDGSFLLEFWPNLSLISCWSSSTSTFWAHKLGNLFPGVPVQGKGLWATEGVVTLPFEQKYPLAICSHFLEFLCVETGKIYPSWKLELGQKLQPLLTTGGGFFRYWLQDEVEVTDFLQKTPCVKFLGRANSMDLVGEKIDSRLAEDLLEKISEELNVRCLSFLVKFNTTETEKPRYALLAEGATHLSLRVALRAEELLLHSHHYRLARELGQLMPVESLVMPEALAFYHEMRSKNMASGAQKIEALTLWRV